MAGSLTVQIEVLWEETLALEDRAGFYDRSGALSQVHRGTTGRQRRS
ncbi:hypothetical protein [Kribbella sp. VKM Ac-2568]|nr:hypothetical protein [Kribbella sp. VKM Ac-2568]